MTAALAPSRFRPGTRRQLKLRMALDGPAKSGKTYTGLRLAFSLARAMIAAAKQQREPRIAVVGTEGSADDDAAEKYIGEPDPDLPGSAWQFDVLHLTDFSPSNYTAAIEEFGRLGYDVGIVDSLSHAWEGKEGVLEIVDKKGKGSGWKDASPMHRRMIEAIQSSPAHVIATMRSKMEYVYEPNEKGKVEPRKVGMAPVQRPGMEYEFDILGSLDWSHIMTVSGSRCRAVDGMVVAKPGAAFMQPIVEWLLTGQQVERRRPAASIDSDQLAKVAELLDQLGWKVDRIKVEFPKKYQCQELGQLTHEQAKALISWLGGQLKAKANGAVQATAVAPAAAAPTATANGAPHATAAAPAVIDPAKALLTDVERVELQGLCADLLARGMTREQWRERLAKYGVTTANALTIAQAKEFAAALRQELKMPAPPPPTGEPATLHQALQAEQAKADPARGTQLEAIRGFKDILGLQDAAWKARLAPYSVESATKLTATQADNLIAELQASIAGAREAAKKGGAPAESAAAKS